jgi:hypothetical protein
MPNIILSISLSLICFASGGDHLNALIRAPRTSNSCKNKLHFSYVVLRLVCGAAHEGAMVEASDGQKSVAVARGGGF